MFQLLLKEEPISLNNTKNGKKDKYKNILHDMLDKKYEMQGKKAVYDKSYRCYILIAYIYKGKKGRDIENILKYTQDAFSKKIFKDDKQVHFCLSEAISCDSGDINLIDMTNVDEDIAADIYEFTNSEYDKNQLSVTYIECGEMNNNFYKIALEEIWK